MNKYYKLIALQIDDFESEIIDELNTGTKHNNEYTSFFRYIQKYLHNYCIRDES